VTKASVSGTLALDSATQMAEAHLPMPLPASGPWEVITTVAGFTEIACYTFQ
jgi:hypothetical protein